VAPEKLVIFFGYQHGPRTSIKPSFSTLESQSRLGLGFVFNNVNYLWLF
jgi:hypothetical protein